MLLQTTACTVPKNYENPFTILIQMSDKPNLLL